jgi:orotate phosphoribosyltransferase
VLIDRRRDVGRHRRARVDRADPGCGRHAHGVAIALDRQEKATENGQDAPWSAVQYVREKLGLHVCAIATLRDLLDVLQVHAGDELGTHHAKVLAYRDRYGAQ